MKEQHGSLCKSLAESLSLKFVVIEGTLDEGRVSWSDFEPTSAAAVVASVLKKAGGAGRTINECLETLFSAASKQQAARGPQDLLQYTVAGTKYTLLLARLVQKNDQTGFERSVSFIGGGGRAIETPSRLVYGRQTFVARGLTREDAVAEQTAKLTRSEVLLPPTFLPAPADLRALAESMLYSSMFPRDERFERIRLIDVYRVETGPERVAAFETAELQLQARRACGACVQWAFHGSSLGAIASICRDGFISTNTERNAAQFGKGIYLSPVGDTGVGSGRRAHDMMAAGQKYASMDKDRVQYVLLCRVLTGQPEHLRDGGAQGSDQDKPSSDSFDTGLDRIVREDDGSIDFTQAMRLVVWTNRMNQFILPKAVVCFRLESPPYDVLDDGPDGDTDLYDSD